MAIKPFAIQGSDLTLGGVNLSAGATTIVIPGVTQATNYRVEEVERLITIGGNNPNTFGSNTNLVYVIDNADYVYRSGGAQPSGTYQPAVYYVDEIDGGRIEEVDVESGGTFAAADKTRVEAADMWAIQHALGEDPLDPFVAGDWTQIPYRPKMRAGVVENVGGGSGGVVERDILFPQGEEGDTAGTLALTPWGGLYVCKTDWTDVDDINKTFNGEAVRDFAATQSGFVYNFIDFLVADHPGLETILNTLNAAGVDYQTDFTVNGGGDFGGAQTISQIGFGNNGTEIVIGWPHRTSVDPTTIDQGDAFTVIYTGTIAQPAIWTRILSSDITTSVTEYATGLTVADKDFEIRTTRSDPGQDADVDIYAADDVFIEAAGDQVVISAANEVVINSNYDNTTYEWIFNKSGHVQFPDGSVQVTAYIAGTSDNNIWVETFTSDAQTTDFVQAASSVEYDASGNIFALFNHSIPTPNSESYTSVAKLTPAGTVLWQVRFSVNLNTDGWGLAYDGVDSVYIAGSTSGTPLTYEFATLTKIDAVDGTIVWSKTYDFEAESSSAVVDVGSDLNPVMVGYAYNGTDNYIITTKVASADGLVIWSKTIDGQGYDDAYGMAVGPTGEVVTIGYVDKLLPTDSVATAVTEPTSNVNWTTPHTNALTNGVNFDIDISAGVPTIIINTDDTGGRVVGDTFATILGSTLGGVDGVDDMIVKVDTLAVNDDTDRMVVVKYATDGTIAWQKAVQFDAGYNCSGADADIDADGNIYVCGQYIYNAGGAIGTTSAMSLVKFNSSGVKQWSRRVVGNCDTFATSVVVGPDNNLYLSGVTGNDVTDEYTWVVAKYDTAGVVVWQRLIDNTTAWTFGGSFWFGDAGGGSNIAVHNGYVALAGSFGDPGTQPKATIVQIDTAATEFSVGDWDIKAATFSGVLNGTASDITVTDADKTTGNAAPTAADFVTISDSSNFLSATRAGAASGDSINNGAYSVSVGSNGVVTMATSRGSLEFGALPEPGAQSHFHIMKASGDTADLFLGDDFNYVLQRGPAYNLAPAYGVEIGTNDNNSGGQNSWRFGTDGALSLPPAGIVKTGVDTAQVGSSIVIATGSAYGDTAVSIASDPTLATTYPAGSTITFQDGDVRTIGGYDNYPGGTDIYWTTSKTGTLFPITLKTANYAAAILAPEWTFGTAGTLAFPDNHLTINGSTIGRSTTVDTDVNGSQLTFTDTSTSLETYVDPAGLTNTSYSRVSTNGTEVILKVAQEDIAGETSNSLTVSGNSVDIMLTDGVVSVGWTFGIDGKITFPDDTIQTTAYDKVSSTVNSLQPQVQMDDIRAGIDSYGQTYIGSVADSHGCSWCLQAQVYNNSTFNYDTTNSGGNNVPLSTSTNQLLGPTFARQGDLVFGTFTDGFGGHVYKITWVCGGAGIDYGTVIIERLA